MENLRGNIFIDGSFVPAEVIYENGLIFKINELSESDLDAAHREDYIIPGLVDIHLHGCVGVDFSDYGLGGTCDILEKMVRYERSVGVTTIVPTIMTLPNETLKLIMKAAADYDDIFGAVCAIRLEGPFLCTSKRGAQNPEYIRLPDVREFNELNELAGGLVKIVDVAPEVFGAIDFIKEISKGDGKGSNITCSIAHTDADYETALLAIKSGANHVTHLYNAMNPFLKRDPGVIGAAFDAKETFVELICDGIHVYPPVIRATFEMFKAERVVLISDSLPAAGMPDGEYFLGGQKIIKRGSLATLTDGTIAGSAANLFDCLRAAVSMGIPKEDAILSATLTPARSIGIDDFAGSIEVGKQAKFVICDKDLNRKRVI